MTSVATRNLLGGCALVAADPFEQVRFPPGLSDSIAAGVSHARETRSHAPAALLTQNDGPRTAPVGRV